MYTQRCSSNSQWWCQLAKSVWQLTFTKEPAHVECGGGGGVGEPAELLECPICIECYAAPPSEAAPVVLPCGHSVCKQCSEDLQVAALCCHKVHGIEIYVQSSTTGIYNEWGVSTTTEPIVL